MGRVLGGPGPPKRSVSMSQAYAFAGPLAAPAAASAGADSRMRIVTDDRRLVLFGLVKVLLTIASLGVYHFWGRAEMRRRIHSAITLDGHPFQWTGTGERSCRNFFIAMIVASPGLWILAWQAGVTTSDLQIQVPQGFTFRRIVLGVPLVFLLGSAVYRRRSHFLRNTWIGGRNFTLTGGAWHYGWQHFWTSLLVPPTLGLILPWRTERLSARMGAEHAYGGLQFTYSPHWRALRRPFLMLWGAAAVVYVGMMLSLAISVGPQMVEFAQTRSIAALSEPAVAGRALAIIGLAVVLFYLMAKVWSAVLLVHQAERTRLGNVWFSLDMPITGYVWMSASNAVLRLASVGALTPWCEARYWRFMFNHLTIHGSLPRPATDAQ